MTNGQRIGRLGGLPLPWRVRLLLEDQIPGGLRSVPRASGPGRSSCNAASKTETAARRFSRRSAHAGTPDSVPVPSAAHSLDLGAFFPELFSDPVFAAPFVLLLSA